MRIHHLAAAKEPGERFAMLTAYDQYSAQIFDEAGIEAHLIDLRGTLLDAARRYGDDVRSGAFPGPEHGF